MTKSTITRERLEQLADNNTICKVSWDERIELAQIALAAMDSSESVELPLDYLQGHKDGLEWAAQLAEANHPETGDWLYDDPIELSKAIRKGPDMPPVQPVADSEPVAWTWHYREQWHVTNDERRAEFVATDGDVAVLPLYRHAQPAPEKYNIGDATMLHIFTPTGMTNVSDMQAVFDRVEAVLVGLDQPAPVVPDGYVMVPMRLTAENGAKGALSGEFSETKFVNCPECFGDEECETCDGSGKIEITVPVTWTTIKAIWAKGVEHFTATPREVKGE